MSEMKFITPNLREARLSYDFMIKFVNKEKCFPLVWGWQDVYNHLLNEGIITETLYDFEKPKIAGILKDEARKTSFNHDSFKEQIWKIENDAATLETGVYRKIVLDYLKFEYPKYKQLDLGITIGRF